MGTEHTARASICNLYLFPPPYPDVRKALDGYRRLGLRVAVFSNATTAMLSAALNAAGLDDLVDTVYSVHELAIFKPDVRVYAAAAKAFGVAPSSIAFHSSNGWDAAGAASCGWRALWINRAGRPQEYPWMHVLAVPDLGHALVHVTAATASSVGNTDNTQRKDA